MDVFVYGTLKAGQCRHHVLERYGANSIGTAEVQGKLYDLGPFPAAVISNNGYTFFGEVYEIPEDKAQECLTALDQIEGHPDFYQRAHITVGDRDNVVCYFMEADRIPRSKPQIRQWPEVRDENYNEEEIDQGAVRNAPVPRRYPDPLG